MGTNNLSIKMHDRPEDAPKYEKPEFLYAELESAVLVGRGTVGGNPTIDLIFKDEKGQKFCALVTGGIVEMLNGAVQGMKQRTAEQDRGR